MTEPDVGIMIESPVDGRPTGEKSMVVYWHPDCFLDEPPYRAIVRWMADIWRQNLDLRIIDEPKEERFEDFVVHHFSADGRRFNVYWENSLGYVSLQSDDDSLLRRLAAILKGKHPPPFRQK